MRTTNPPLLHRSPLALAALALTACSPLLVAACSHSPHAGSSPRPAAAPSADPAPPRPALTEAAIAVPIRAGKTADWQHALEELTGPRYAEYEASRTRYGLTSQTTFVQQTPMGDFALIHLTGPDVRRSFHAMSTSQDPWDVEWRKMTQDLHGMDFARTAPPDVEPLFATSDTEPPRGEMFMFVAPVADVAGLQRIAAELRGPRHDAYVAAREQLGIHREAAFLETTGAGNALVVYWRADDPVASLHALAGSHDPFDAWLAEQAARVHPLPLEQLVAIASHNRLIARYPHAP